MKEEEGNRKLRMLCNELLFSKFQNAIQDANTFYRWENHWLAPERDLLQPFHSGRRIGLHYFLKQEGRYIDSMEMIQYKTLCLLEQIQKMDSKLKRRFCQHFGDVLEYVESSLIKLNMTEK